MPTADQKKSLDRLRNAGPDFTAILPKPPPLPREVVERFPSMSKWQKDWEAWVEKSNVVLGRMNGV